MDAARVQQLLDRGDAMAAIAEASTLLRTADARPAERVGLLCLRARAHEIAGDAAAAVEDLRSALRLSPQDARLWNELGVVAASRNDPDAAADAFRRAVAVDPEYFRAWNNLGNCLSTRGDTRGAADAFRAAVQRKPDYALAWANLGAALRNLGDAPAAEAALQKAASLDPKSSTAVFALGGLCRDQGRLDDAVRHFALAAQRSPAATAACLQLAGVLAERDELDEARSVYAEAIRRDPTELRGWLGMHLSLPMVPADAEAIRDARARFARGLDELPPLLRTHAAALAPAEIVDRLVWSNFLLAYHGEDDRPLQGRFASMLRAMVAPLDAPTAAVGAASRARPAGGPLRVGFVSSFFRDGTVGRYFEHWITGLDRERFDVHVYHLGAGVDALGQRLAARADVMREMPRWAPSRAIPVIGGDALDVLVYPELGMDASCVALAAVRLAPLQCAAWGHPVTTGQPAIDVFLSCAAMEPDDAASHYTETLVCLPGIGTRYALPALPDSADRAALGLPADGPLFLCPQSLFKIHPDDDALYARVLAAVPAARLVLFQGRHPRITARFAARLNAACERAGVDMAARILWLPQCGHETYLRINMACTAMLDTTRWSGGNTTLDALATGLPVLTRPGRFMRARQSTAMLQLLGVGELVSRDDDDTLRLAARLAGDTAWRDALRARILASRPRIFEDPTPVQAFADWLASAGRPPRQTNAG